MNNNIEYQMPISLIIDKINDNIHLNKMSLESESELTDELKTLSIYLNISALEAFFFSIVYKLSENLSVKYPNGVYVKDIAKFLRWENTKVLSYYPIFNSLIDKGFFNNIRKNYRGGYYRCRTGFIPTIEIKDSIVLNKTLPKLRANKFGNFSEYINRFKCLNDDIKKYEFEPGKILILVNFFTENNLHLKIVRILKDFSIDNSFQYIYYSAINEYLLCGGKIDLHSFFDNLSITYHDKERFINKFYNEELNPLLKFDLIKLESVNNIFNSKDIITLTTQTTNLLQEEGLIITAT